MDIRVSEDTLAMARQAKQDQGQHETEVSFNGECDLHRALVMCDKNPGHENFIPVHQLSLNTLPADIQTPGILNFLKAKSQETVRLSCCYTSWARPPGYTFHQYRGSKMMRVGSGRVWAVYQHKIKHDIPCPFLDCPDKAGQHTVSGYLRVHTAMHVVFDDEEAQRTTVDFFYDSPGNKSSVVTARGVRVVKSDIKGDFCVMECVTHDPELCVTLDKVREYCMSSWPEVKDQLYGQDMSMVVSHPHGCSKQVSVGTCLRREWKQVSQDQSYYRYAFTAATCPGCSGAPVWVPGADGLASGYASHSEHLGNGVGMSAFWFYWKAEHDGS